MAYKWVVKATTGEFKGKYVDNDTVENSYTNKLSKAKLYDSLDEAFDKCALSDFARRVNVTIKEA